MNEHDPLCWAHHPTRPVCMCRQLRTARLQGPVKSNRHAPLCWCPECLAASDRMVALRTAREEEF